MGYAGACRGRGVCGRLSHGVVRRVHVDADARAVCAARGAGSFFGGSSGAGARGRCGPWRCGADGAALDTGRVRGPGSRAAARSLLAAARRVRPGLPVARWPDEAALRAAVWLASLAGARPSRCQNLAPGRTVPPAAKLRTWPPRRALLAAKTSHLPAPPLLSRRQNLAPSSSFLLKM